VLLKEKHVMKRTNLFRYLSLAVCTVAVSAIVISCKKKEDPQPPANTLVDVATNAGLTRLTSALGTANLVTTLRGTGPFTVFAPTNAAFEAANVASGDLSTTLLYHVFDGKVLASAVPTSLTAIVSKNPTGDSLYVKRIGSDVFVNGQRVTTANAEASNGVAHIIGRVLIPAQGRNIVQLTIASPGLDSLEKAVLLASAGTASGSPDNIAEVLSNIRGATVFAPTNQAFADVLQQLTLTRLDQIPVGLLRTVLRHHVFAGGRVFSNEVPTGNVGMANGTNAVIAISGSNVTIKGSGATMVWCT
jgi:uncharacterized surface protein with fasciclin (FAS1) repeats